MSIASILRALRVKRAKPVEVPQEFRPVRFMWATPEDYDEMLEETRKLP